jgi:hypothetical protein
MKRSYDRGVSHRPELGLRFQQVPLLCESVKLAGRDHHQVINYRQSVTAALCSDGTEGAVLRFRGAAGPRGAVPDENTAGCLAGICTGEDWPGTEERCLDPSGSDDGMSNKTLRGPGNTAPSRTL